MQTLDRGEGMPSVGGLSLVGAVATFLAMWGGLTLLLTDPQGPSLPPLTSTPRGMLVSLLLFWVPLATGGLACLSGVVGLVTARGQHSALQRRAIVGVLFGLAPACLAAAWLGWMLVLSLR
jgi:hypothetical protein